MKSVIAVLDDFTNLAMNERNDDGATEREIVEARATVAELIEAGKVLAASCTGVVSECAEPRPAKLAAFKAALARAQGGQA